MDEATGEIAVTIAILDTITSTCLFHCRFAFSVSGGIWMSRNVPSQNLCFDVFVYVFGEVGEFGSLSTDEYGSQRERRK
jgi:hypothetical protein